MHQRTTYKNKIEIGLFPITVFGFAFLFVHGFLITNNNFHGKCDLKRTHTYTIKIFLKKEKRIFNMY